MPDWASEAVLAAPFAVLRRAAWRDDLVPVGIRGNKRGERLAAWLKLSNIHEVVTPEFLVNPEHWKIAQTDSRAQVLSLKNITEILKAKNLYWGPTGSAGFELATGVKTINTESDLDLILRFSSPLSVQLADSLLTELTRQSLVRLDIQLDTPKGGVSLSEYVSSPTVLVKTQYGPIIAKTSEVWS